MKPSPRPAGLTLISILFCLLGLLALLRVAISGRMLGAGLGIEARPLLAYLALAALLFVLAWGMWRLYAWARWLAVAGCLAAALAILINLFGPKGPDLHLGRFFARALLLAILGLISGYLFLPHVRRAFRRS